MLATNKAVKASLKAAGSTTINAADMQTRLIGGAASVTTGVGVVSQLTDALHSVPPLAWAILALLVLVGIYLYTHRIETAISGVNTEVPIMRAAPIDEAAAQPLDSAQVSVS